MTTNIIKLILSTLSAILLISSFSSFNLSLIAWASLVFLFFAIDKTPPKQAFFLSYFYGFLFFLSSMYWLIFVTPAGWFFLSLYQGLYFGLFGYFFSFLLRTYSLQLRTYIYLPSLWCTLEYLRSHIGGGIGWNLLGYSQYQNLPIIQIADITGVYGVSFLIVLVNFAVFAGVDMAIKCRRKEVKINPLLQTLLVFFAVSAVLIYGYKKIADIDILEFKSSRIMKISVMQGNIPQFQKWDPSYKNFIMQRYRELSLKSAKEKPDLVIWPETSLPGYPDEDKELMDYIRGLAKNISTPILTGAPTVAVISGKDAGDYNSALLFLKDGKLSAQYNKMHLVAFGEFIPFEKYLSWLRRVFPITGNFISGDEYTIFNLPPNFGVLICFEDIFPYISRRFVKDGADFMINITNDAWFGKTCAAYQHAANSVFRAIENRRPFVRSANTGLSCFIDRTGRIYDKINSQGRDLFVQGYKTAAIVNMPSEPFTFYTRFGDIFILFCLLITGFFIIDYLRRGRYNK